jgi:hypothetical protein
LTTGGVAAIASSCSSSAALKFETPIERARPRSRATSMPGHAQVGPRWGQWMM